MWPFTKSENTNKKPAFKRVFRFGSKGAKRNYNAAKSDDLTFAWATTSSNIDSILTADLTKLRDRSRHEYRNNDYMHRFISLVKTNVIGHSGVKLQVHSQDTNGQLDELANQAIESAWQTWSKRQHCDYQKRLGFKQMQNLLIQSVFVDGEAIVQMVKEPANADFAFSVLIRQTETLDHTLNEELSNGHRIRLGIEFNAQGRAVNYYFKVANGHNGYKHDIVPAERILHFFLPEFIEQVRGVPQAAAALTRLNMLGGFEEAALVNARAGATKMGFITMPEGEDYGADAVDDDGYQIDEAAPGEWHTLPAGAGIADYDPAYPSNEFGVFVKSMLRGIASGLGISYHTLANDLEGVNYSSGRLGELADREVWKGIQDWFIEQFMHPIFEVWLKTELQAGNIKLPNGRVLPYAKYSKFNAPVWQARRWQWVDPQKEMNAHEKAISLGLKSRSEIIREMGRDPNEVWREIERENTQLKNYGINTQTEGQQNEPVSQDTE